MASIKQKETWNSAILFNIHHSLDKEPSFVNLSDYLVSSDNYAFPSHFDGIENKDKLLIALRIRALKSGFALVVRSSKSNAHLDKHHSAYIALSCQHGVVFRSKKTILKRRRKIQRQKERQRKA